MKVDKIQVLGGGGTVTNPLPLQQRYSKSYFSGRFFSPNFPFPYLNSTHLASVSDGELTVLSSFDTALDQTTGNLSSA